MLRWLTVIAALSAIGSGLFLYSEKHKTALVDHDIAELIDRTKAAHERIAVLKGEWQQLNNPDELKDRAERYLHLESVDPSHYVKLSDLANKLPAPGDLPMGAQSIQIMTASLPPALPAALPSLDAPVAAVLAAKTAPLMRLADATPAAPLPGTIKKTDVKAKMKSVPRHQAVAAPDSDDDDDKPHGAPLPLAAPAPVSAGVLSAMAHTHRNFAQARLVTAAPHYAPQATPIASSLSFAGHLPPPVPLAGEDR
jgi:hypothetical protein